MKAETKERKVKREIAINNLLCLWRHGGAWCNLDALNGLVASLWIADQAHVKPSAEKAGSDAFAAHFHRSHDDDDQADDAPAPTYPQEKRS